MTRVWKLKEIQRVTSVILRKNQTYCWLYPGDPFLEQTVHGPGPLCDLQQCRYDNGFNWIWHASVIQALYQYHNQFFGISTRFIRRNVQKLNFKPLIYQFIHPRYSILLSDNRTEFWNSIYKIPSLPGEDNFLWIWKVNIMSNKSI